MAMVRALIFGSIGTITETSDWQREAFNAAFDEHGVAWHWSAAEYRAMISGDRISYGGGNRIAAYAQLRGEVIDEERTAAIHATKTQLFQDRLKHQKLPLNPGVDALLSEAERRGIKTVFASATARASIDAMLLATEPVLTGRFDLVMSADDIQRPKPDPEIYLTVLERLNLDAREAVAIEDSQPSLDAARHAGIATYAVPGVLWRGFAFEGAAGVFDSLDGIDLATLMVPLGQAETKEAAVATG